MKTTDAPPQTEARGQLVPIEDLEIYYEEHGAGEPLVLLHGFGGSSQNWGPFVADLAAHHRLIVVDLRGHGDSTNPAGTFTHRQAARDVSRLLDALGVDRFSAMGMSSGGMALLHLATGEPGRVDSMVLISATTRFPAQARAIMRRASLRTMPPEVQAMYRACAKRGDPQIRALVGQFNRFAESDDDMDFTAARLSTIRARTLVVHGDRDHFFPVEIAVELYRSIPDAALWILPGGEHVPIFDPSVPFTATALRFLAGRG
ncbi:MAG: alpha/beta hydrolase [Nannocystaceae bacterium]